MGTTISEGVSVHGHRKGTRLYKIIWDGYAAEEATWEPSDNIHPEVLADYAMRPSSRRRRSSTPRRQPRWRVTIRGD